MKKLFPLLFWYSCLSWQMPTTVGRVVKMSHITMMHQYIPSQFLEKDQ